MVYAGVPNHEATINNCGAKMKRRVYDIYSGFVPAESRFEAVNRLSALTHSHPQKLNKNGFESKSLYLNLATGLGLDIDTSNVQSAFTDLVEKLNGTVDLKWFEYRNSVNLDGLNYLLGLVTEHIVSQVDKSREQVDAVAGGFTPARSKIEAVIRIAALTNAPEETLGPGSKERKSVMVNLARNLGFNINESLCKEDFGAELSKTLNMPWDSSCWSYGHTITLEGLNRILHGATIFLNKNSDHVFETFAEEGKALGSVVVQALTPRWEAKDAIEDMFRRGSRQWKQTEWAGFYFEEIARSALVNVFGGGPKRIGTTDFDYSLNWVWDFKSHNTSSGQSIFLNDYESMYEAAAEDNGIGFILQIGSADLDVDFSLRNWRADFIRSKDPSYKATKSANSKNHRLLKLNFTTQELVVIVFDGIAEVNRAVEQGFLKVAGQGRQANGSARKEKYSIRDLTRLIESDYCIYRQQIS